MKMLDSVTLRVSGRAPSATRTDTNAGRHALVMDEPEQRHGNDAGMLPLQALMCSLAGCTNVVANWIAGDLGIEIRDMSFDIAAMLDTRSIAGVERVDPPFPEIEFAIEVTNHRCLRVKHSLESCLIGIDHRLKILPRHCNDVIGFIGSIIHDCPLLHLACHGRGPTGVGLDSLGKPAGAVQRGANFSN